VVLAERLSGKIWRAAYAERLSFWLPGQGRRIVLRREEVLKFAADFLNAVANVLEPSFDLFGAELDRFASLLAGFL
jgi:hypothetical protein